MHVALLNFVVKTAQLITHIAQHTCWPVQMIQAAQQHPYDISLRAVIRLKYFWFIN